MEEEGLLLFLSHWLTFCFFLWGHFCLPVLLLTSQGHSWNSSSFFFFGWWVIPLMPVMAPCTLQLGFSSLLCAVVWLYRQEFQVLRHRARTCKLNWIFSFPLKVLLSCWIVRFFLAGQFFFFFKSVSVFLFTLKKSRPWIFPFKKSFNLALSSLIINKWSCCF